jgi:hypothetical protein
LEILLFLCRAAGPPAKYLLLREREVILFSMQEIGKFVMILGLFLVVAGVALWRFPSFFGWIGKLPGDISVQKGSFSFYFPVVTCIVISIVVTFLSWLFRR